MKMLSNKEEKPQWASPRKYLTNRFKWLTKLAILTIYLNGKNRQNNNCKTSHNLNNTKSLMKCKCPSRKEVKSKRLNLKGKIQGRILKLLIKSSPQHLNILSQLFRVQLSKHPKSYRTVNYSVQIIKTRQNPSKELSLIN